MRIEKLRDLARREEIDYQFLLSALKEYSRPRDKISEWLENKDLIRVKKGLYIFGSSVAKVPYSQEILANLIYGPSAISLSYALSYYGLIPERVTTITSITNKRNKNFITPIGDFKYRYLNSQKYSIGIELETTPTGFNFLIASPEKALCDFILLEEKEIQFSSVDDCSEYLLHDLRLDQSKLLVFREKILKEVKQAYRNEKINYLYNFIKKWKSTNA